MELKDNRENAMSEYHRLDLNKLNYSDENISYEEAVNTIPLKDKVVIIKEKNIRRLLDLYGEIKSSDNSKRIRGSN